MTSISTIFAAIVSTSSLRTNFFSQSKLRFPSKDIF